MQLVINIPEGAYEEICSARFPIQDAYRLVAWIQNGKPLPKGHGQLKDAEKIGLTDFECLLCNGDYKEALKMLDDKIKNAPIIIPAEIEGGDV